MQSINSNPAVREGDSIETEWSQVSYAQWCVRNDAEYVSVPGLKIVNLYDVINSVIESDLTENERTAVRLFYFEGLNKNRVAAIMGTSYSNIHSALKRAEKKLQLVLKHLINCEEYKKEEEEF